jgi:hypothetical protein
MKKPIFVLISLFITIPCLAQSQETEPEYPDWIEGGKPECWCYPRQCHGDCDGELEGDPKGGYFRVGAVDLDILLASWKELQPAAEPDSRRSRYSG